MQQKGAREELMRIKVSRLASAIDTGMIVSENVSTVTK